MIRMIGGKYKGKAIEVPKQGTRPTLSVLREALFNICQQQIDGATFLDLFAGGGAIGLEALSRGALHVTFIEKDRRSCRIIEKNLESLGIKEGFSIIPSDVFKALAHLTRPFTIIFADPPYDLGLGDRLIKYFDANSSLIGGDLFVEEGETKYQPEHLRIESRRKLGRSTLLQLCKGDTFSG